MPVHGRACICCIIHEDNYFKILYSGSISSIVEHLCNSSTSTLISLSYGTPCLMILYLVSHWVLLSMPVPKIGGFRAARLPRQATRIAEPLRVSRTASGHRITAQMGYL